MQGFTGSGSNPSGSEWKPGSLRQSETSLRGHPDLEFPEGPTEPSAMIAFPAQVPLPKPAFPTPHRGFQEHISGNHLHGNMPLRVFPVKFNLRKCLDHHTKEKVEFMIYNEACHCSGMSAPGPCSTGLSWGLVRHAGLRPAGIPICSWAWSTGHVSAQSQNTSLRHIMWLHDVIKNGH